MPRNRSHPTAAEFVDRAFQAFELRTKGWSCREIAVQMQVSTTTVYKWMDKANRLIVMPGVLEFRKMENERLDYLLSRLAPKIEKNDTRAIEVAIKLLERRAKLNGLDAPIQHDVKVHEVDQRDLELAELTREAMLRRHDGLDAPAFARASGPEDAD